MFIKKKRIRNLKPYIGFIKKGSKVMLGVKDIERYKEILKKVGFTDNLEVGESVLPSGSCGSVSNFNAEGKYIKHKDQPMETAYRIIEWHWKQWNGPYDKVERSRLVDVSYKRYPRTFIPPPGIEITLYKKTNNEIVLVGPIIEYSEKHISYFTHIVNLFLEIFGECHFFTENFDEFIKSPIHRLNWKILPPGPIPWSKLKQEITPLIKLSPKENQPIIEYRLKTISNYKPDFTAIGEAGFRGYIILGFNSKKVFMCESLYYGNATYIFNEQWESLSKKTKAEILGKNLQDDRIIHMGKSWEEKIKKWVDQ